MIGKIVVGLLALIGMSLSAYAAPLIIDKPIVWTDARERLTKEYALEHYGRVQTRIVPRAVVVHWTAFAKFQTAFDWFYNEADAEGELNVASHFIVDRDGTIYRLTDEHALNRHAIGYNWCAIGIENVGGVDGREDLTDAQLEANVELIRYLRAEHPTIKYVFGHYQQDAARASGLHIELVADYYAKKIDPGVRFMTRLRDRLGDEFIFFDD